jgi:hypothetical protein
MDLTNKILSKTSNELISALERVKNEGVKNQFSFDIDLSTIQDFNFIDIRESHEYKALFNRLMSMNGPVLYWLEIDCNIENSTIRAAIENYSKSDNSKAIPALKKRFDENSKCLYVGKVKKSFWGRLIQHLGFYKVNATQGLQLFYWAKDLNLKLKIHTYEFEQDMEDLVSIFEIKLAKELRPLIGKH